MKQKYVWRFAAYLVAFHFINTQVFVRTFLFSMESIEKRSFDGDSHCPLDHLVAHQARNIKVNDILGREIYNLKWMEYYVNVYKEWKCVVGISQSQQHSLAVALPASTGTRAHREQTRQPNSIYAIYVKYNANNTICCVTHVWRSASRATNM